jgi:hypothetical protein
VEGKLVDLVLADALVLELVLVLEGGGVFAQFVLPVFAM